MPELPEVETTRRGIEPYLTHHRIKQVIVRHHGLRWAIPASFASLLENQLVRQVDRRGKYIILHLEHGDVLIHLGMSGRLGVLPSFQPPQKHDHVDIILDDGKVLRLTDYRRFGAMIWTEDAYQHPLIRSLGPEPLERSFNANYLLSVLENKNVAIKIALMDSKIVVGVGNIYANEALFIAGIHPKRPAKSLAKEELTKLVAASKAVLKAAIKKGGTTLRDYYSASGEKGFFLISLKVYGRGGKPCLTCGHILEEFRLGQRATVYCPICQPK